jgi:hypothetical protein
VRFWTTRDDPKELGERARELALNAAWSIGTQDVLKCLGEGVPQPLRA